MNFNKKRLQVFLKSANQRQKLLTRRVLAAFFLKDSSLMLKNPRGLPCAVVVISLISHAASVQQYTVRLDRPEKAGDRYHLLATSTETTTAEATVSDQLLRKSEDLLIVELSADVTISRGRVEQLGDA